MFLIYFEIFTFGRKKYNAFTIYYIQELFTVVLKSTNSKTDELRMRQVSFF